VIALLRRIVDAWLRFWFAVDDTRPLELVRIGTGVVLFIGYAMMAGHVAEFFSDDGWLPMRDAVLLRERASFSLLYDVTDPWRVRLVWGVCLGSTLLLTLGWRTSWVKWIALACHVSFMNRAPNITYGVDHITGILLWLLCFAPIGRALALDAGRSESWRPAWLRALDGARASACQRLVQIQMAIVFFFAGTAKLRGNDWWDGDAIWYALADQEFNGLPLQPFAENMWVVNALTYFSVLVEIGYAFLVWDRKTRPFALVGAVSLHAGIATMLSMILFGLAMIAGHLAFTPSAWIDRLVRRRGAAVVDDGRCAVK
jgi:uncharacterized membrane protein YphA (DoxX/SURF4 family)